MRAFNSALSRNISRGRLSEVNIGRDAPDKTNQIFLLSVMGFTRLSWCGKSSRNIQLLCSHYPGWGVMTADTLDMVIMLLDMGFTCFVLMSIKHIQSLPLLTHWYRSRRFSFFCSPLTANVSLLPSMSHAISVEGVERKKQQRSKATSPPSVITSISSHTHSRFHVIPIPKAVFSGTEEPHRSTEPEQTKCSFLLESYLRLFQFNNILFTALNSFPGLCFGTTQRMLSPCDMMTMIRLAD